LIPAPVVSSSSFNIAHSQCSFPLPNAATQPTSTTHHAATSAPTRRIIPRFVIAVQLSAIGKSNRICVPKGRRSRSKPWLPLPSPTPSSSALLAQPKAPIRDDRSLSARPRV
jgi:hypothetical protein